VVGVNMVRAPSNEMLAMHFCPLVAGVIVCRLLGAAPSADQLKFIFDLTLRAENPNPTAIPAVEALVAFTAFPAHPDQAKVGAVCVSLCEQGTACAPPPADGCTGGEPQLVSMDDYRNAAVGFLLALATGQTQLSDVRVRMLPPRTPIDVVVRLELSPTQILSLLRTLSRNAIDQVKSGRVPAFAIPYSLTGSVWIKVEQFGRIAASFGPVNGQFNFDRVINAL